MSEEEEQRSLLTSTSEEQHQESLLIYSFVARGAVMLAESSSYTTTISFLGNNLKTTALQFLENLPSSSLTDNNLFTYSHGHSDDVHTTFSYLVYHGFTYCVVSSDSADRWIPVIFLERVKDEFIKRYGGQRSETAAASSLDQEFGPELKQQMEFCVENQNPKKVSRLAKVKTQQDKEMLETIDKILVGSATVCHMLDDDTDDLGSKVQDFRQMSSRIKRKMWLRSMNIIVVILGTLVSLILVLVLSICGSFDCTKN